MWSSASLQCLLVIRTYVRGTTLRQDHATDYPVDFQIFIRTSCSIDMSLN